MSDYNVTTKSRSLNALDLSAVSLTLSAVIVALYSALITIPLTGMSFWQAFSPWLSLALNDPNISNLHPIYIALIGLISVMITRIVASNKHPSPLAQLAIAALISAGIFAILRSGYWAYRWITYGHVLEDPAGHHMGHIVTFSIALLMLYITAGLFVVQASNAPQPARYWIRLTYFTIAFAVISAAIIFVIFPVR